jgi:hypothetical protein
LYSYYWGAGLRPFRCAGAFVSLPGCDYDAASSSSIRPKPMRYPFVRWRPPRCAMVIHPRARRVRNERITVDLCIFNSVAMYVSDGQA